MMEHTQNNHIPNTFRGNLFMAACAVVLGVLFDYLFYQYRPGISFVVFIIVGLAILYGFHYYFHRPVRPLVPLSAGIIFFSLMVGVRASPLLTFLNIVLVFYLLLLLTRKSLGHRLGGYLIKDYVVSAIVPLWNFAVSAFRTLGDLLSLQGVMGKKKTSSQVVKGLLMALPVLLVFLLLFASADLVFQKSLTNLFHLDIPAEFIRHIAMIAFVTLGSLGALAYVFKGNSPQPVADLGPWSVVSRISALQISVFLGLIDALFLVFILFQFRYLFGGQVNIVQQGFTYAEYAHRGFAELIAVALLSLVLMLSTERHVDRKDEAHLVSFKTVSLLLVIEVIVIMASAFKRLNIYQDAYGFTVLRFYVSVFIIWVSALFLVFGYKILKSKKDQFFALSIFAAVVAFVAIMNVINPEAIIVRQNIKHFVRIGKMDTGYLGQLSEDAVPAMLPLLNLSDGEVKQGVGHELYDKWHALEQGRGAWQEARLARTWAEKLLNQKASVLQLYKEAPVVETIIQE